MEKDENLQSKSKKLLCHHVHDAIVQLSFTDFSHLTRTGTGIKPRQIPAWDGGAPRVSLQGSGCCGKFVVFELMLFGYQLRDSYF